MLPDQATEDDLDPVRAWQTVRDLRIPADLIPVRESEFEEAREHAGTLGRGPRRRPSNCGRWFPVVAGYLAAAADDLDAATPLDA